MENHKTAHDLQQQTELSKWKISWGLWEICFIPVFLVLLPAQGDSDPTPTLSYKGKAAQPRGHRAVLYLGENEALPSLLPASAGLM